MQINIGLYDAVRSIVPVEFIQGEFRHERDVNACKTPEGEYDPLETRKRVSELLNGIIHKVGVGAIFSPEPIVDQEPVIIDQNSEPE